VAGGGLDAELVRIFCGLIEFEHPALRLGLAAKDSALAS
jgi:hypothetical protein